MIYRQFQDLRLSGLGLGMMRLPVLGGDDSAVDEAAAAEMIDCAYRNGINYFDTAWGYHNGNSELTAGKFLSRYPRESYFLATKFPGYDLSNMDKAEEIFERQLVKCQTPYFDFYLFHNVYEGNIDAYLDPKYGILRQAYGVLPAAAQLYGLALPERSGKGGAAQRGRHPHLGHGTPAGR